MIVRNLRAGTLTRMEARVAELVKSFPDYVARFDEDRLFGGPSIYFHQRTLDLLREFGGPQFAVRQRLFVEALYATLTAWGMHRMGPAGAKLVDFSEFEESLREAGASLATFGGMAIHDIAEEDIPDTADRLWSLLAQLRVSKSETKIVAGSKAIHHLLPDLLPPIDRQYTLQFFYQNKMLDKRLNEAAFKEMFPRFHRIAESCRTQIEGFLGHGMNTSFSKVIDNAIVGYVRTHLSTGETQGANE